MSILLIDVDSLYVNIAIMKLSTYFKAQGKEVHFKHLDYDFFSVKDKPFEFNAKNYEAVYISNIFATNKDKVKIYNCKNVYRGGSGYDWTIKLPQEIDDLEQDRTLYPDKNVVFDFITRGCIRKCPFCIVWQKEGNVYQYRTIDRIWQPGFEKLYEYVDFMDNNFLALPTHKEVLQEIIDKKIPCKFKEGLDVRLIDEENARLLSELKHQGEYIFAFDNVKYERIWEKKIKILKQYITRDWNIKAFVFSSPEHGTTVTDCVYRTEWLRANKILPYITRHTSCFQGQTQYFYKAYSNYVNMPRVFKKMTFKQFVNTLYKKKVDVEAALKPYREALKKIPKLPEKCF